jgi:nucleoside-diphosphate-sugar epimerase
MRILIAGGSGVIGARLIPALITAGHDVVATTRRMVTVPRLQRQGATGMVMDAFDAAGVRAVTAAVAPDLVIHELTDLTFYDRDANALLRREGTANLVAAAEAAGVSRMMVQSIAFAYVPGDTPAGEDIPLRPGSAVAEMEGLVSRLPHATMLRYGMLYGPDTWYDLGGRISDQIAGGQLPATPAITSFVHIDDAVTATVQAIGWPDGAYNIVDDEPAPGTVWMTVYAAGIGSPRPRVESLPDGAAPGRGASNAKACSAGWTLVHPSWRDGFPRAAASTVEM